MERLTKFFKALANDRRIAILRLLRNSKAMTMTAVAKRIHLSFRSTSKHLLILENAGLLRRRQEGLLAFYSINEKFRKEIDHLLALL